MQTGMVDGSLWPAPSRWPERWRGAKLPRVLIEDASPAWRWRAARALAESGCEVGWCEGPDHSEGRGCPLLEGGSCPLIDGADLVIFGLGPRSPECRALLDELVDRGKNVLMELVDPRTAHHVPAGVIIVPYSPDGSLLAHFAAERVRTVASAPVR